MSTRVILLAGPSGSGKTSLLRRCGARRLKLDDFYRDGDEPGMPLLDGGVSGAEGVTRAEAHSAIDWDNPASWDADRAMTAILDLCATGTATVPVYSIPDNATVDYTTLDVDALPAFVAEGVFAAELVDRCREAGVLADALVLRRPRLQTWWFRLRRDLAEHRKPVHVLLRRGLRLAREEPAKIAGWAAKGCRPVDRAECEATIARHLGADVQQSRADDAA
ncbi:ATP-binding protein [Actinomyces sp. 432]|uniref:ATP-binding protein n=1 Tax=unclassified Actinomyces TaxID=2609248 RepID=UPI001373FADC|nr:MULTISPECIES: ATP-binding protein [unclassified Actinomyces]MBW3069270.1 ATP-binding protein [Actinomyces sp. 594]QHO92339.1 ATP-binding protein [Actinomyces sp. 432]